MLAALVGRVPQTTKLQTPPGLHRPIPRFYTKTQVSYFQNMGNYGMQNNQLPTKTAVELKGELLISSYNLQCGGGEEIIDHHSI
jgi:hypothetical protein